MNDWEKIRDNINKSKIFRFNYKELIGESLTSYITKYPHLSNIELRNKILAIDNIQKLIISKPEITPKLLNNLENSISSRKAEQISYKKRLNQ